MKKYAILRGTYLDFNTSGYVVEASDLNIQEVTPEVFEFTRPKKAVYVNEKTFFPVGAIYKYKKYTDIRIAEACAVKFVKCIYSKVKKEYLDANFAGWQQNVDAVYCFDNDTICEKTEVIHFSEKLPVSDVDMIIKKQLPVYRYSDFLLEMLEHCDGMAIENDDTATGIIELFNHNPEMIIGILKTLKLKSSMNKLVCMANCAPLIQMIKMNGGRFGEEVSNILKDNISVFNDSLLKNTISDEMLKEFVVLYRRLNCGQDPQFSNNSIQSRIAGIKI